MKTHLANWPLTGPARTAGAGIAALLLLLGACAATPEPQYDSRFKRWLVDLIDSDIRKNHQAVPRDVANAYKACVVKFATANLTADEVRKLDEAPDTRESLGIDVSKLGPLLQTLSDTISADDLRATCPSDVAAFAQHKLVTT